MTALLQGNCDDQDTAIHRDECHGVNPKRFICGYPRGSEDISRLDASMSFRLHALMSQYDRRNGLDRPMSVAWTNTSAGVIRFIDGYDVPLTALEAASAAPAKRW